MSEMKKHVLNEFNQQVKPVSLWADAWKRLRKNSMALIGLYIVGFYLAVSLAAPILPLQDPNHQELMHINLPPSLKPAGVLAKAKIETRMLQLKETIEKQNREDLKTELLYQVAEIARLEREFLTHPEHSNVYILGTDYLGRDMLARIIYGGRISMGIGVVGTITAVFIGIIFGAIAGYAGGNLDNYMMRFVDIMYGLPYMLVVIILMSMVPSGSDSIFILFIAIALVSWLTIARVVRGQIISLKNAEFVEAARSMGASPGRIIFRHLLPNTLGVIIIFATLQMPSFIMNESFLSFLGLGVSAPAASWGTLVADGVKGMELYPWRLVFPALSMTIFLFAMNFLGDGLRDALDPQSKNRT
ncbi:MAG: peptide ABC transporter permease [Treponema sp. GWB1_62_6]|nr:MAG: peptide ABC transporter permease [Treponema sp. GWB1_62_6]OHE69567.1 MAG: peptide ABC transporter permease [Treponema sp. GWC1_61_84]OHE76825.1 MAG: peptide ABC transporter permease [Treponema sp. RIFOXYC1_FULL_61_9]HCM26945.1 ABC transporter permease [Treponema sp.]